jgi:hypothetical protein
MTKLFAALMGLALAIGFASPALAANMEVRFDNTVKGTRPDGTVINMFFEADNTFTGKASPGSMPFSFKFSGTWRMDGDKLCILQTEGRGKNKGIEKCETLEGDKVGDTWTVDTTDQDDKPVVQTMTIVEGR